MINFVAIDPARATVEVVSGESLYDVLPGVGLRRGEIDFGLIHRYPENGDTITIVVYEFGMYLPVDQARYFSLGHALYVGGAILYAADYMGDTVSLNAKPPIVFYKNADEVERAIAAGDVQRPEMAVNGEVVWRWPDPRRPF